MTQLLITPLGSVSFKWGGLSSIRLGVTPGHYSVLPLPSTIAGALKYALAVRGVEVNKLGFEGPVFYAEGEEDKKAACVLCYPKTLVCNVDGKLDVVNLGEEVFELRVGISLNRPGKTVAEGPYLEKFVNFEAVARAVLKGRPKRYGVLIKNVQIDTNSNVDLDRAVVTLGAESRPAVIRVFEADWKKLNVRFLASPAVVTSFELTENGAVKVKQGNEEVTLKPLTPANLEEATNNQTRIDPEKLRSCHPTLRPLSLGFDMGRRREMRLALLPTLQVKDGSQRIGDKTDDGWGSVVEL